MNVCLVPARTGTRRWDPVRTPEPTANGKGLHPQLVSQAFERSVGRAGVPVIRFHDLRHTHATLMLGAGVHPKVVQERLGHASIQITLDTYSHVMPGMQAGAAAKLADLVFGGRAM